jgi:hypothetical protein
MSSNSKLDIALQVLRNAGHKIGSPYVYDSQTDGSIRIPIDDVPRCFEDIFEMAEEEKQKPGVEHKAEARTGQYVRMILAPNTRMGTLGEAKTEHGRLEYLFHHDTRFDDVLPPFYVPESDVEACSRPTDDQVTAINKLSRYGSKR